MQPPRLLGLLLAVTVSGTFPMSDDLDGFEQRWAGTARAPLSDMCPLVALLRIRVYGIWEEGRLREVPPWVHESPPPPASPPWAPSASPSWGPASPLENYRFVCFTAVLLREKSLDTAHARRVGFNGHLLWTHHRHAPGGIPLHGARASSSLCINLRASISIGLTECYCAPWLQCSAVLFALFPTLF